MNVAAAVSCGRVDTGMGIRAAALALNLDFVPIAEERYDLIVPIGFLEDSRVQGALELTADAGFRSKIEALGGYNLRDCGSIMYTQ